MRRYLLEAIPFRVAADRIRNMTEAYGVLGKETMRCEYGGGWAWEEPRMRNRFGRNPPYWFDRLWHDD